MDNAPNSRLRPHPRRTARMLWMIGLAFGIIAGFAVAIPLAHANAFTDEAQRGD